MSTPAAPASRNAFISHAHADNSRCTPYAEQLRARGVDVWYDLDNAPEGHTLTSLLQQELQARSTLIVFVTPAALQSFWVNLEIDAFLGLMAQDRARMLLPVRLEPCEMPPFMNTVLWIDGVGLAVEQVVERIAHVLSQHAASAPAQAAPASPGQPVPSLSREEAWAQRMAMEAHEELLASHWNDAIVKLEFARTLPGVTLSADELGDLAQAYGGAHRWTDALNAAQQATQMDLLRADLWQIEGRAHTTLAQEARERGDQPTAARHEQAALSAFDKARALLPREDLAARLALLAERRAVLVGAEHWVEALGTLEDELALAPSAPTRLAAQLDVLRKLDRRVEALAVARALAGRPDATFSDYLNLVRQLRAVDAPEAEITAALEVATRLAGSDPAARQQIERERATALVQPERFPPRLAQLGFIARKLGGQEVILPPLCDVPAGPFLIGSDPTQDRAAYNDEKPQHRVTLPAFQIARFPVTVAEYACFVRSGHAEPAHWQTQLQRLDHPVVNVSWRDAVAYAQWLAERTEQPWRLPSEAEWEKAARWDPASGHARIYPWGDQFDPNRSNTRESGIGTTTPVGSYAEGTRNGASPCGAQDMAGNVWEWTASAYADDYSKANIHAVDNSTERRVLRGGSGGADARDARAACRGLDGPDYSDGNYGFRLARAVPSS